MENTNNALAYTHMHMKMHFSSVSPGELTPGTHIKAHEYNVTKQKENIVMNIPIQNMSSWYYFNLTMPWITFWMTDLFFFLTTLVLCFTSSFKTVQMEKKTNLSKHSPNDHQI